MLPACQFYNVQRAQTYQELLLPIFKPGSVAACSKCHTQCETAFCGTCGTKMENASEAEGIVTKEWLQKMEKQLTSQIMQGNSGDDNDVTTLKLERIEKMRRALFPEPARDGQQGDPASWS